MKQFLIAVDQVVNTLIPAKISNRWVWGYADETLSARAYRLKGKNKKWFYLYKFINMIFFLEQNHCQSSYVSEKERRQLPVEYRL